MRWLAAAMSVAVLGCFGGWGRAARPPGSALWVGAAGEVLEPSRVARLREAGVGELFVEAGRIDLAGGGGIEPLPAPQLPPSTPVTLVLSGKWAEGIDSGAVARRFADGARAVRLDAEARGAVPVGVHLDVDGVRSLEAYGALLEALRDELDGKLFLSASVAREWVGQDELEEVADAVDFVVAFLYGQRPEEPEAAEAWDFVRLERGLETLEKLDVPYLLGVVTLGTAHHLSSRGNLLESTTALSLRQLFWNPRLKLRVGFSLQGVNRRVYALAAERPTTVGGWKVAAGDQLRVVRASTTDLEELMRLLGARELPNHLGELYFRQPAGDERLSLTAGNILNALAPAPATPELKLSATVQRRMPRGWIMRFSLANANGESTALSLLDGNYVEVAVPDGRLGRLEVGDYYRYDLYRRREDGTLERTFRRPDTVRLYAPIVEGRQTLTSGDVEILVPGDPKPTLSASFLLNDGRNLEVGPVTWRQGETRTPP